MMARAGLVVPDLAPQSIAVGGVRRSFVAAPGPDPDVPLLLVLHGAGGTGLGTAALSGLAERGPAAGCAVAFPDGFRHVWNDRRHAPVLARRERIDDVAFLQALVEHLRPGGNGGRTVYAIGMSNGGFLAEHVARHGLLDLDGRRPRRLERHGRHPGRTGRAPSPLRPLRFLAFHGTADPLVAYGGGPIGPLGRLSGGRPARAGRGVTAPIEHVAADWAAGPAAAPRREAVAVAAATGGCTVERLTWPGPDGPARRPGRDALPHRRRWPHLARRRAVPPRPHRRARWRRDSTPPGSCSTS